MTRTDPACPAPVDHAPGQHLLIDHYGSPHLRDADRLEAAMRAAALAAGAVVLHVQMHRFPDRSGVTGVALLAESHISVHTWPDQGYAALDVFMCGQADAQRAAQVLQDWLAPTRVQIQTHRRGADLVAGHLT